MRLAPLLLACLVCASAEGWRLPRVRKKAVERLAKDLATAEKKVAAVC